MWTTSICLLIAGVASTLAISDFTRKDTLWCTVATSVVIGAGTSVFDRLNSVFGEVNEEDSATSQRSVTGNGDWRFAPGQEASS